MINELEIEDNAMESYNLENIGLIGELVKENGQIYIMTESDTFPIYSSSSFKEISGQYILSNGEEDPELYNTLSLTTEQFEIIKNLLV